MDTVTTKTVLVRCEKSSPFKGKTIYRRWLFDLDRDSWLNIGPDDWGHEYEQITGHKPYRNGTIYRVTYWIDENGPFRLLDGFLYRNNADPFRWYMPLCKMPRNFTDRRLNRKEEVLYEPQTKRRCKS